MLLVTSAAGAGASPISSPPSNPVDLVIKSPDGSVIEEHIPAAAGVYTAQVLSEAFGFAAEGRYDPSIVYDFDVTNTTSQTGSVFLSFDMPISPLIGPSTPTSVSALLSLDLEDTSGDGEVALTLRTPFPIQRALAVQGPLGDLLGLDLGTSLTGAGHYEFSIDPQPGLQPTFTQEVLSLIVTFELTPGDTARLHGEIHQTIVPEPAVLWLLAMGGGLGALRRRLAT
jgi:hypothetical protein